MKRKVIAGRKEKLSGELKIDISARDLAMLKSLAELCCCSVAETVRQCIRFSGAAVRRKYIKQFVKRVRAMRDPFEALPVFEPAPRSDEEFEDRVLDKLLAYDKEVKRAKKNIRSGPAERFKNGYTQKDFYAAVDESDRDLAEKTISLQEKVYF